MFKEAQQGNYASPSLKNWLRSWKEKPEHALDDEDTRYVVQPIPNNMELPKENNENNNETSKMLENDSKNDSLLNASAEAVLKEEKPNP